MMMLTGVGYPPEGMAWGVYLESEETRAMCDIMEPDVSRCYVMFLTPPPNPPGLVVQKEELPGLFILNLKKPRQVYDTK